jgi:hypothetical protein
MKRTLTLLSGAALALSLAAAQPARAVTPPNGAIQGTWAFGGNVLYVGSNQSVGTFTFNGNGGVTGVMDFNYFGTAICNGMTVSGTYTVNPGKLSGTAVMTLSSVDTRSCANTGNDDTLSLAFYLGNNLKTMNFVETDPHEVGYFGYDFYNFSGVATHF